MLQSSLFYIVSDSIIDSFTIVVREFSIQGDTNDIWNKKKSIFIVSFAQAFISVAINGSRLYQNAEITSKKSCL